MTVSIPKITNWHEPTRIQAWARKLLFSKYFPAWRVLG